ncbi:MAG: tetratricopeptide repeat protein [Bacteroidota bacterium]
MLYVKVVAMILMIITLWKNPSLGQQRSDTTSAIQWNDQSAKLWRSDPDSSRLLATKALVLSDQLEFEKGRALSFNNLGALAFFNGRFDSARYYWDRSLKAWQSVNDEPQVSKILGNLALALKEQGKLAEAIQFNQKAVALRQQFKDSLQLAIGYNNLGILYDEMGDTEKALHFHYRALNIRGIINDSVRLSSSYANLGTTYTQAGNYDSAKYFLDKALVLKKVYDDIWGMASVYGMLTELYFLQNSLDSASIAVTKGLKLAAQVDAEFLWVEMKLWEAKTYLKQDKLDLALQSVNACEAYLIDQNIASRVTALHLQAQIYYKKGQYEKAAKYYNIYAQKSDSINRVNTENKIEELTAKYFYDLREVELKRAQELKQAEFDQLLANKQTAQFRLLTILVFVAIILIVTLWYYRQIKIKNSILNKQRQEIQELNRQQQDIIEMRTAELLSTKDLISRYAFLNSHELRAPLARILGIIHLSDKKGLDEDTFIKSLKDSAHELDEAVRKISDELNKH